MLPVLAVLAVLAVLVLWQIRGRGGRGSVIGGVKDATNDLARPLRTRAAIGADFAMLSGEDVTVLAFLGQGGDGDRAERLEILARAAVPAHREHRGHGLGLATKAVNLRAAQASRDDLTLVTTQNAETNGYMVAINEQMGFAPIEVATEFVKRL